MLHRWLLRCLLPALTVGAVAAPVLAQWRADGMPVSSAASNQRYPNVVGDAAGGVIAAWMDYRSGTDWDIYAQRFSGAGVPQWAVDGVALCTAATDQGFPPAVGDEGAHRIAADGAGGAIVTWSDGRGGWFSSDIYVQHVLASGVVDPLWPVDGRALCTAAQNQQSPAIVSDGAGGAIVAWKDLRNSGTDWDVYAQHVLASGVVDQAWPANGRALCTAAGLQISIDIVGDGAGGAIVAWQDFRSMTGYHIYAQRVLASGAVDPAWPVGGRSVCAAANSQYSPKIVGDGAGGAIVAWYDYRGGIKYDIYAQHVLGSGAVDPAWPTDGRALCTAPGDQDFPAIIGDGAGGAIVTWNDHRNGNDYDVYAQHVRASGAVDPAWPTDGRALATAAGDQYYPTLVSDGTGGAIVTWGDGRLTDYGIYAQHVLASGAVDPVWPADGRALCTAANDRSYPTALSDGAGGAIVTWEDRRSGATYDIYAQRVYASGEVAAVPPTTAPARLVLLAPYPNPLPGGLVRIPFSLPTSRRVSAQVLDLAGHRVRTLVTDQEFSAGRQTLEWDGRNDQRARVPAGVYFVRVHAGEYANGQRILILE